MRNLIVAPVEHAYRYELSGGIWSRSLRRELFEKNYLDSPSAVRAAAVKKLPWDATISVSASGVTGAAVGSAIAEKLIGTGDKIATQLGDVVKKLDEILNEIRALRDWIRDENRSNWQRVLDSEIGGWVEIATVQFKAVKADGRLPDLERQRLYDASLHLMHGLETVARYNDPIIGKRVSMPLYAGVKAGLVMLAACDKFLGAAPETRVASINGFEPLFKEWAGFSRERTQELSNGATAKAAHLNAFPKVGVLGFGGIDGDPFYYPLENPPKATLIYVELAGSADEPFRVNRVWMEPVDTLNYAIRRYDGYQIPDPLKVPRFPFPWVAYSPSGTLDDSHPGPSPQWYAGGLPMANQKASQMVADLNGKRQSLLDDLAQIDNMRAVTGGLESAFGATGELVVLASSPREADPPPAGQ